MKFLSVPLTDAQKAKSWLMENNLLEYGYAVIKEDEALLLPINNKKIKIQNKDWKIVERDAQKKEKKQTDLKKALAEKLPREALEKLKTSFDIIGDIAILEIDEEMIPYEKMMAEFLLDTHKNVETVLKKAGTHKGDFRTQDLQYVAGVDKRETIHKENGVRLKLKVGEVYFSGRLSTERTRIMKLVRKGERILVMFAGCGPYTCVLGKNTQAKEVIGVEWNPEGHKYATENIQLNKIKNAVSYCGNVREVVPQLEGTFDRILMPLPKNAGDFLDVALTKAKKSTIVHMYDFLHEDDFHIAHEKIESACKTKNLRCKILNTVKCGQHAPRVYRICVDFEIV